MDQKQISILNSLVTFAAEQIQGGLSEEEREVAQIVGRWALGDARKTHDYKVVNGGVRGSTAEDAANTWAKHGWRVVGVLSDTRPGYANALILERPTEVHHPDD